MSSPYPRWEDVKAEMRAQSPAFDRYATRFERHPEDALRSLIAGHTRRIVEVSTRKYRARKGRKRT